MSKFAYLSVLLGCLVGTAWLEYFLRTKVYRRTLRLILTVVPVVIVFSIWDAYAIAQGHWTFDLRYVTGITTVADIPLDEILFFFVGQIAFFSIFGCCFAWNTNDVDFITFTR